MVPQRPPSKDMQPRNIIWASFMPTDEAVPKDETEAAKWYLKAAEQGDAAAQNKLGAMYAKARAWHRVRQRQCAGTGRPPSKEMRTPKAI